ncbi:EFR1 family ferrodoxin [Clostridium thailandense]|uniref:EFR1 family ferrodoxin n=1 Tax=Clostridium thailandense TaxID=2794346 RepID=UPI00398A10BD
MSTTIYYFTGTGNSLKVAKDLSGTLEEAKLVQICRKNIENIDSDLSEKIGFVFPVYFSGLPIMVKEFLEKLQINENAYIFAVATFGAGSGISVKQIENILNKKGAKLSASFGIAMPGNYLVMYSPYSEEKQQQRFKKEEEEIFKIAPIIKDNIAINKNSNLIANAIGGFIYKNFKPNDKDKNFWTDEKCNGCGTCSKICPANNIKIIEGKPKWQHSCELCVGCIQWCPQEAIQYKKSTVKRGRYHHPNIKVIELFQSHRD